MSQAYQKILNKFDKYRGDYKRILDDLEEIFVQCRDKREAPIYLTKCRVKDPDSAYLKIKRFNLTQYNEITDYAGLRILCLFEQEVFEIHDYLLKKFTEEDSKYKIKEIKIYNWPNDAALSKLMDKLSREGFRDIVATRKEKESGYKSFHYLISVESIVAGKLKQPLFVEIQLRTLLQDVWSELEHAVAYKKGDVNPQIRQSFKLLSTELSNNDKLVTNLKEISDRENYGDTFVLKHAGPASYFGHEKGVRPKTLENKNILKAHDRYVKQVRQEIAQIENREQWYHLCQSELAQLNGSMAMDSGLSKTEKKEIADWEMMEKAFLEFKAGRSETAEHLYTELLKRDSSYKKRPILFFRLGELYLIQGRLAESLRAFDNCEHYLEQKTDDRYQGMPEEAYLEYRMKGKLAYVYWLLGEDYYENALSKVIDASKIYEAHKEEKRFADVNIQVLFSNLCWYHLEMYCLTIKRIKDQQASLKYLNEAGFFLTESEIEEKRKIEDRIKECSTAAEVYHATALDYYSRIKQTMSSDPEGSISSNIYDTLAWFCYQTYKKERDQNWLDEAYETCMLMLGKSNRASLKLKSDHTQRNHILYILEAVNLAAAVG